jgi:hypothetical protein
LLFELQKIQRTNLDDKGLESTDGNLMRKSTRSIPLKKLDGEEVKISKMKKIIAKKVSNIPIKNIEGGASNKKINSALKVDKSEIKSVKKRGKLIDEDDDAGLIFENEKTKKQKTTTVPEVYIYLYIDVYMYIYIHVYTCICILHRSILTYIHTHIHIHMYTYTHIYIYTYMYIHIYIYIHYIHIGPRGCH